MPSASSISWTFPFGKILGAFDAIMPIFDIPLALVAGIAIAFFVATIAAEAFRSTGDAGVSLDSFGGFSGVGSGFSDSSLPDIPTSELSGVGSGFSDSSLREKLFGIYPGIYNANQDHLFGDPPIGFWRKTFNSINPFRRTIMIDDFIDPIDYLEYKGDYIRANHADGEYWTPELLYQKGLASLDPSVKAVFLKNKPHLDRYYDGKLSDHQLLETFISKTTQKRNKET